MATILRPSHPLVSGMEYLQGLTHTDSSHWQPQCPSVVGVPPVCIFKRHYEWLESLMMLLNSKLVRVPQ